ncbi:hypothetical protein Q8F55_005478 [Vanrija albida]|uniref:Aminoglycoside phosphotransferase domain-containing protein n=1 Tax=Vanrija albida TaxID=181172 RepID=A0ABR3Q201_9TREE
MFDTADRPGLCHYQDCSNLALVDGGGLGPCFCCGYQGCALHLGYEHDTCFSILQVIGAVAGAAGPVKVATLALRPGVRSRLDLPPAPEGLRDADLQAATWKYGSMNVHFPVVFEDGAVWQARVKMEDYWPKSLRRAVVEREVATLRACIPSCRGSCRTPHPVFMLVEHVEGITFYKALKTKKWDDPTDVFESVILPDLAAFYIKLTSKPFTEIGCLALAPASTDQVTVGPLQASVNPVFWSAGAMGPFGTNATAWLARIDHVLWLLDQGAIYPPNGDKMHCWGPVASDPVAMYLVHLEARRLVQGCAEMAEAAPTYICHNDDNGDHYLLAEDGRVRGVIDWEMAYTAPLAEVFATNYLWKNGPEGPSRDELRLCDLFVAAGRGDLAAQVKKCRKYHYLRALVGGPHRLVTIDSVWRLRRSFLGDAAGPVPPSLGAWMADRMGELGDDGLLRKIAARVWEGEGGAQAVARQRERYIQQHEAHCQKQKDEAEKAAAKGKEGKQAEDTTSSHDLKGAEESHL